MFQRTPVWCWPKPDFTIGPWLRAILGRRATQTALSGVALLLVETLTRLLVYTPPVIANPAAALMDSGHALSTAVICGRSCVIGAPGVP